MDEPVELTFRDKITIVVIFVVSFIVAVAVTMYPPAVICGCE